MKKIWDQEEELGKREDKRQRKTAARGLLRAYEGHKASVVEGSSRVVCSAPTVPISGPARCGSIKQLDSRRYGIGPSAISNRNASAISNCNWLPALPPSKPSVAKPSSGSRSGRLKRRELRSGLAEAAVASVDPRRARPRASDAANLRGALFATARARYPDSVWLRTCRS